MNSKSILQIGKILTLLGLVVFSFFTCQDEVIAVTIPNDQNTITVNSDLAGLLLQTATLDGSFDNILDGANCITINLPVTVIVNGVDITIDSEADYEVIEAIFDEFSTDEDGIEIVFPIVIVLNDYTTVEIVNQDELETFIDDCLGENEEDDDIECIDFQYPIVFSIYDSNFQITETVTIANDEALYQFIENLEGGVLVSLNFPVTMILSDGSTVEVNNNEELQAAIEAAEHHCDEDDDNDWNDDDCTEAFVELALKECIWNIVNYNGDAVFSAYDIYFNPNFMFTVSINGNVIHDGSWSVLENEGAIVIHFETSWEDLNGNWTIIDCDEDRFELVMGDQTMVIEQNCDEINTNPFECFGSFGSIDACDGDIIDGFAEFDLNTAIAFCTLNQPGTYIITYHETQMDAINNVASLPTPESYTNLINPQEIYIRVELYNDSNVYEIYPITLIVENCGESCNELTVDDYLQTCIWNVVNYNGSNDLINYDLDFQENGVLIITGDGQTLTSMWTTSTTNDGVWVVFDGVNGPNIQAISGHWLIVACDPDRLQMNQGDNTMVLEQDCTNNDTCSESDVDAVLMACEWTITSYAGGNGFSIFNINFMDNQELIIASDNESYTGNWSSNQDGAFVFVAFSNISGGNVQVFNGLNFKVVECTTEQMIFHDVNDSNNELILDRVCN